MDNLDYSQIKIEDPNAIPTEASSVKEIIVRQLNHCLTEGSKEMDGGGVRRRVINGQVVEIAVPNQREIFINSVQMLFNVLESYLHSKSVKKEIKEKFKDFDKNILEVEAKYNKDITLAINRANFQRANARGWVSDDSNSILEAEKQEAKDRYELNMVKLYKKRLNDLCFLLDDLDYFSEQGF